MVGAPHGSPRSQSTLKPRPPVARQPALVRYNFYAQNTGCNAVIESKRKAIQHEFAEIRICGRAQFRMPKQEIRGPSNFTFKTLAQPRYLKLVELGCFGKFHLRFGMELKFHRFRRARRFAKTRSPGIGFTFPLTTSRCRLCASFNQASSTSASAGPSSSPIRARRSPVLSSRLNDRILASMSAISVDMTIPGPFTGSASVARRAVDRKRPRRITCPAAAGLPFAAPRRPAFRSPAAATRPISRPVPCFRRPPSAARRSSSCRCASGRRRAAP